MNRLESLAWVGALLVAATSCGGEGGGNDESTLTAPTTLTDTLTATDSMSSDDESAGDETGEKLDVGGGD